MLLKVIAWKSSFLPEGSLRARLAIGAFWSIVGALFGQGLRLLSNIVIARSLGKTGFGEYGMIISTVGLIAGLGGVGIGVSVAKHVAEYRTSNPGKVGHIIGLSMLASSSLGIMATVVFYFISPIIATNLLHSESLIPYLRNGSLIILFSAIDGTQVNALAGFEAFRGVANINLIKGALEFSIVGYLAWAWGLEGAVWGMLLSTGFSCLINHIGLKRECRRNEVTIQYRLMEKDSWQVINFGIAAFMGSIVLMPAIWGGNAILVNQPDGYAELGLFTAADKWRLAILFLPAAVSRINLPVLSNLYGESDRGRYRKVFYSMVLLSVTVTLCGASILSIFSKFIMGVFGKDFSGGAYVLGILAFSGVFVSLNTVFGQVILSANRWWERFSFDLILAILLFLFAYLFVPRFGATGLASAYALSFMAVAFGLFLYIRIRGISK